MAGRDIIVVGASSGGLTAMKALLAGLPEGLPAAVFVVWHIAPTTQHFFPDVLGKCGPFRAAFAQDGEAIEHGRVYAAPTDRHMVLEGGRVRVNRGPRENRFRPAVDPLFRSAAREFGERVVGIVLSGALDDGVEGLGMIKRNGGVAIVQEPGDAAVADMPLNALAAVEPDYVLPASEMGAVLARLAEEPSLTPAAREVKETMAESNTFDQTLRPEDASGPPTAVGCPDCNGAIWRTEEGGAVKYECYVGHKFSEEGFLAAKNEELEIALWSAVRVLKESGAVYRQMADRAAARGSDEAAKRFRDSAEQAMGQAEVIRRVLSGEKGFWPQMKHG